MLVIFHIPLSCKKVRNSIIVRTTLFSNSCLSTLPRNQRGSALTTLVPVLDLGTWGHHRHVPPSLSEPGSAQWRP